MGCLPRMIYADYAAIYDAIGQTAFAERMAPQILDWHAAQGFEPPRRVLDLACGTGAASLALAAAGCSVVGIDRAPAMLAQARAKAERSGMAATFIQADIRRLSFAAADDAQTTLSLPPTAFDLAICLFDSLNCLLGDDDLEQVCAGAAQLLRPGGCFVFDMNTEAEFAAWDERDQVVYDGRDYLVYNRLSYDPARRLATGRIGWFTREIDRWRRGEETHVERAWSAAEVVAALQQHGLVLLDRRTPQGAPADATARRVVYYAHLPLRPTR